MIDRVLVVQNAYHDSAFLMRVSRELKSLPGVEEAVVLMGTPLNRELLGRANFSGSKLQQATPMDLLVAIRANQEEVIQVVEQELDRWLRGEHAAKEGRQTGSRLADLDQALRQHPEVHLVSIAVPGAYAAYVAHRALDASRHVFLFSNNVSLEDEVSLKQKGRDAGLLVMGPDCGTAIISGAGLGFANRVLRGNVGLVGASGTGMQEVSCLLSDVGQGISQAIGTGSRDLSEAVGGMMSKFGLRLLAQDEQTSVIILVAKHPAPKVAQELQQIMADLKKPVVVRYLGQPPRVSTGSVRYVSSLDEAALAAAALASKTREIPFEAKMVVNQALSQTRAPAKIAGRLVGLFGGGSLLAEARVVLEGQGFLVQVPETSLSPEAPLSGTECLLVDTGEDCYTQGRPHPMVDQSVRCDFIRAYGSDPSVGLLLLDVVLGDGAHPDPALELAQAVEEAQRKRVGQGAPPILVVASLCGTQSDPQDKNRQRELLAKSQILVMPSAALAAHLAAALLKNQ